MPSLIDDVARAIGVIDVPTTSDAALVGDYLEMGYTNRCLELSDMLMLMVGSRDERVVVVEMAIVGEEGEHLLWFPS
ncbi:hypothetical protein CsSME_00045749 [Camellia sinensis var. sinensis]